MNSSSPRDTEVPRPVRLFLSCVSAEFHKLDPEGKQRFLSYRDHLAQCFRKARVEIMLQEDLAQGFGDLLQTLDDEIARSTVVVHLVGDMAGASPQPDEVRRLRERHADLFVGEPTLRARLDDPQPIAYTQWELYLTFQHRGRPLVYLATPETLRSPCHRREAGQLQSQERHRQTITSLGKHWEPFVNQDNLALKLFIALTANGVLEVTVPVESTPKTLSAARASMPAVAADIGQRIKSPDLRSIHVESATSVDIYSHALESTAQARGVKPRDLVQLLHEHRERKQAEAEAEGTPAALCDLALTQIALADYEAAIQTSTKAAQLAETGLAPGAADAEQRREAALNAWLLVAEAARAARLPAQAITAQEKGGRLIDRAREPLFWADYHQPLAELLLDSGRYADAEHSIRAIIDIREKTVGGDPLQFTKALYLLGRLLYRQANYLGAEVVASRLLRMTETIAPEVRGSLHAASLSLLGLALTEQSRHDEAEVAFRQALELDEKQYGPGHPEISVRLANLGSLLRKTNRLAEAEPLLRRALAIKERIFGLDHPGIATHLRSLALLLQDTNRLAEAEPLLRRALAIDERTLGQDHPSVAKDLVNLAGLLQDTSRLAESEPLYRRAVAIFERSLGSSHPTLAQALDSLAGLLKSTKRLVEAEPLYRRALSIHQQNFGADHPSCATSLNNIAELLRDTGRPAEAEPLYRQAATIFEQKLGRTHPKLGTVLNNLAQLLQAAGQFAEAEVLVRRALAISEQSLGPDHPDVAIRLMNLARLLEATHRLAEAEPLSQRGFLIFLQFTAQTGHQHPNLTGASANYRHLLVAMGCNPAEAQARLNELGRPYGIQFAPPSG